MYHTGTVYSAESTNPEISADPEVDFNINKNNQKLPMPKITNMIILKWWEKVLFEIVFY
jgi:hypothetical protein